MTITKRSIELFMVLFYNNTEPLFILREQDMEDYHMIGKEVDYSKLFGNIESENNDKIVAAKCRCVACNSCSCGRCLLCIGQCTGCKSKDLELDLEWGMA